MRVPFNGMMLDRGSRVGPYEVVSAIGAGGMGEVYRARDPRLARDVALKILPAGFVHDPDRIARFRREAQMLAALNHPHIAHLYGLEEVGGTTALVLEFVDGETLSDIIARGTLPIQEALKLAYRIADALEAAHEHGIVHRDLKPTNIKVDHSGQLKLLDFGLAKALQGESAASGPTDAPTVTSASTRLGVVLGTAAYMSPEQARGLPVDRRTDHLLFPRRGSLMAQPFDLSTGKVTGEAATVANRIATGQGQFLLMPLSVSSTGTLTYPTYVPAMARLTWFDRRGNRLGTIGESDEYVSLALNPDESRLAVAKRHHHSAEASLWVLELPRAAATRVTHGAEDVTLVRWSPDSQRLVFSATRDNPFNLLLQTISDGSGKPELLLNPGIGNWLNDWSRDGRFVLYAADSKTTSGDLWILPLTADRTPKPFLNSPYYEGGGAFSPDSRWIAYTSPVSGRSEIYLRSFPGAAAERQVSTAGGVNPVWRNDGRELFFITANQTLMAATLAGNKVSEAKALFRLPSPLWATGRWHQYTVSGDGSRILAIVPEPQTQPKSVTVVANWPGLLNAR